jgi:Na+/H+ antiporter NhaD/arsenite permease-like protein
MFAGLFIIVAGAQRALLTPDLVARVSRLHPRSNAHPERCDGRAVEFGQQRAGGADVRPFVQSLPDHTTAWLTIAMASTLAGNFTILGSIANLIVVQKAASRGVEISFWDYLLSTMCGSTGTTPSRVMRKRWIWPIMRAWKSNNARGDTPSLSACR